MSLKVFEDSMMVPGKAGACYTDVLCSRICHDLISPIGAIKNGLELVDDNCALDSEIKEILNFSARQALDRLTLYRSIFGLNGIALIGSGEKFQELFNAWCHAYKIQGKLEVGHIDGLFQSKGVVVGYQLLLRLFLVIGDLVPLGGDLEMTRSVDGLNLQIKGRLFPLKTDYYDILIGNANEAPITPQTIFAYYFSQYLEHIDWQMDLHHDGKEELKI